MKEKVVKKLLFKYHFSLFFYKGVFVSNLPDLILGITFLGM